VPKKVPIISFLIGLLAAVINIPTFYLGSEPRDEQPLTVSEMPAVEASLPVEERPVLDFSVPAFTKKIDDVITDAGKEARFDARIHAVPEPKVEWYHGPQKILDKGRFVHVDAVKEDLFTLIIENTEPGDAGHYKCVASNEAGETSCEAQLTVKGKQTAPETPDEHETSFVKGSCFE